MSVRPQIVCVTDPLGPGAGAATLAACSQAVRALEEKLEQAALKLACLGQNCQRNLQSNAVLRPRGEFLSLAEIYGWPSQRWRVF